MNQEPTTSKQNSQELEIQKKFINPPQVRQISEPKAKNSLWKVMTFAVSLVAISSLVFASLLYIERSRAFREDNYPFVRQEVIDIINKSGIKNLPEDKLIREGELKGLVSSLEDPYSIYLPKAEDQDFQDSLNQRYEGVGIKFDNFADEILVQQVFQDSPAEQSGVLAGDILIAVDDENVRGREIGDVAPKIRGEQGTKVKLTFVRNNQEVSFNITRDRINTELISLRIENQKVVVIEISSFGENLDSLMKDKASQILANPSIEHIVIDVRGNSGGLLNQTIEIISYFVEPGEVLVKEITKNGEETLTSIKKDNSLKDYPVTVLVDGFSASASEILAGALRDIRSAQLIGQKTFGKGTVQQLFELENGDKLKLTIAEWFTPNGVAINKQGLAPDILTNDDEDALQTALIEISSDLN